MSKATKRRSFTATDLQERIAANPALRALNPQLEIAPGGPKTPSSRPASELLTPSEGKDSGPPAKAGKKRKEMNQTEREFAMILQSRVNRGEIVSFGYEEITLRFGEGKAMMTYTPDFFCIEKMVLCVKDGRIVDGAIALRIVFREVKGGHIWPKDLVKFKAAMTHFRGQFKFELHQKKNREWTQLI